MKITGLDPLDNPTGDEEFPVVPAGQRARRVKLSVLAAAAAAPAIAQAQNWAEGAGAPGGGATKSAKSWVNYLLNTNGMANLLADLASGASKVIAVGTDLLLGAASKIAIAAADLALGAAGKMATAPQAALDAAAARDAAIAAAAGVPVGANFLILTAPPANNVGQTGDVAYNTVDRLFYSRTPTGWSGGVPALSDLISRDSTIYDLVNGSFGALIVTTRAHQTTNLLYSDTTRTAYTVFPANTPAYHPIIGLMGFQYSRQYAPQPVNPGNGSFTVSLAAGKACVKLWGAGTIASAAAVATPATFTNSAGAPTDKNSFQTLTITSAGSITFTVAGSDATTLIQVEQHDLLPTTTVPTPFMPATGARNGDKHAAAGTLQAAMTAAAGTVLFDVTVPVQGSSASSVLSFNSGANFAAALQADGAAHFIYTDIGGGGSVFSGATIGNNLFSDHAVIGFTWKAGRVGFGGGDRVPSSSATTIWNGTARTAALFATGAGDIYGQQSLNGGIRRLELLAASLDTDLPFYDRYTMRKRPTLAQYCPAYRPTESLSELKARLRQLIAGTVDYVAIPFTGNSGVAGVPTKVTSFVEKLKTRLAAKGMPVYTNHFGGLNNSGAFTGGGATWDSRVSTANGTPLLTGGQGGSGPVVRIPAGCSITITFATTLTKLRVSCFPGSTGSGQGSFSISANGGAAIVPLEGGAAATPTANNVNALIAKTFQAGATAVWTITATGGDVMLDQMLDVTPGRIQFINMGLSSYGASNLNNDGANLFYPNTGTYWAPLRLNNPPLIMLMPDNTNSASAGIGTLAAYRTNVAGQLDKGLALPCDIVAMTNQPVKSTSVDTTLDRTFARALMAEVSRRPTILPFRFSEAFDAMTWEQMAAIGWFASDPLHLADTGHDWLWAEPMVPMFTNAWTAAGGALV